MKVFYNKKKIYTKGLMFKIKKRIGQLKFNFKFLRKKLINYAYLFLKIKPDN